jgi:hypothetical protein
LCLYIAFDALDVDGSAYHARLGQALISSAAGSEDIEKVSRGDLFPSGPIATLSIATIFRLGQVHVRPQLCRRCFFHLARRSLSVSVLSSSSADPA